MRKHHNLHFADDEAEVWGGYMKSQKDKKKQSWGLCLVLFDPKIGALDYYALLPACMRSTIPHERLFSS